MDSKTAIFTCRQYIDFSKFHLIMKKVEMLSPQDASCNEIITNLEEQLTKIQEIIKQKQQALKNTPKGFLRAIKSHNSIQYFQVTDQSNKNGKYIPRKNLALATQLAQKAYDAEVLKELKFQQKILKNAKNQLKTHDLLQILHKFPKLKSQLMTPIALSDDDYAAQWQSVNYERKAFLPGMPEYFTAKGERVRSKSEILIADTLTRFGIPYRYEFPVKLRLNDGTKTIFHPDFYCLNLRTRKEFVWEHFGMMDNEEYSSNCAQKMILYQNNGYYPGESFLFTMETNQLPLNTKYIEKIIKKWLA